MTTEDGEIAATPLGEPSRYYLQPGDERRDWCKGNSRPQGRPPAGRQVDNDRLSVAAADHQPASAGHQATARPLCAPEPAPSRNLDVTTCLSGSCQWHGFKPITVVGHPDLPLVAQFWPRSRQWTHRDRSPLSESLLLAPVFAVFMRPGRLVVVVSDGDSSFHLFLLIAGAIKN